LKIEVMGAILEAIREKLAVKFQPSRLEVTDDSARHAGHSGAREGGESHFNVLIEAAAFSGMNRVARQRAVYGALKDELAGPVHALSLTALAPGEPG
jgi:BolA protein